MVSLKRRMSRRIVAMLFALLLLIPATSALTASDYSSKTGQTAAFSYCGSGVCVPLAYVWDGGVRTFYDWADLYHITLHTVDQSVTMRDARNSPCSIGMGISTDTFLDGNFYGTVYRAREGSYAIGPNDIVWGGFTDPEWFISPGMTANTAASSGNCLGGGGFSFYVSP